MHSFRKIIDTFHFVWACIVDLLYRTRKMVSIKEIVNTTTRSISWIECVLIWKAELLEKSKNSRDFISLHHPRETEKEWQIGYWTTNNQYHMKLKSFLFFSSVILCWNILSGSKKISIYTILVLFMKSYCPSIVSRSISTCRTA